MDSRPAGQRDDQRNDVQQSRYLLWALTAMLASALLVFSQTMAFVWDEGFHLLAAQLIRDGKTPYLDFCFPQPPLNAYLNAALFYLFGTNWRITHVIAALFVAGTTYLTAEFVLLRFPIRPWRSACVLLAALFVGLNEVVVQFGPIAQAYASAMFFAVLAFRMAVAGASRESWLFAFGTGLSAGTAAACTLLAAPVTPVLFGWTLFNRQWQDRSRQAAAFIAGCSIPFTPVLWLFIKSPRQTFFNVVQYQALFRRVNWGDANSHDFDVFTAWLNSVPTFLTVSFSIFGVLFVARQSRWERLRKAEFYLCAWIAAALTIYIATAHPTFQRYFIVAVPFFGILGAIGFFSVASRLGNPQRPFWAACLLSGLLILSIGKELFDDRESTRWSAYDEISAKVAQVTPAGSQFYADEQVYFLLHKTPPPGMEFSYSHKLELPASEEKLFHIVSEKEVNAQVRAGKYATVESCKDDRIEDMHLSELFPYQVDIRDCSIFWGPLKHAK